jgi:hypothetical protein
MTLHDRRRRYYLAARVGILPHRPATATRAPELSPGSEACVAGEVNRVDVIGIPVSIPRAATSPVESTERRT